MAEQSLSSFADELLETNCLCCSICKDILKPPIMLMENIGNICATCYDKKSEGTTMGLHNAALETVLGILKLPCKFQAKGCTERLSLGDLNIHQNNCKHRNLLCPFSKFKSECTWAGSVTDFVHHFKNVHADHIISFENVRFYLRTALGELDIVKLLVTKRGTYILRMQTNSIKKKLYYLIYAVVDDPDLLWDYSVKHKGNGDNYIKTESKILAASNNYTEFDESVAVEVDMEAIKQIAQVSDTITNVFKIKIEPTIAQSNGIDEKMLLHFACPICENTMKPPIYQCLSGHSICNVCRPRLDKCPTCRAMFGTTRNYSLEGLTFGIHYPCMYNDMGCTQTSAVTEIVMHERKCPFKPCRCPFPSCTCTGNYPAIITHLEFFHAETIVKSPGYTDIYRFEPSLPCNEILDRKCVIAYDHIFRLTCKRVPEYSLWVAEIVGSNNDTKTFIYEVAIVNMHRPGLKIIRTDYCLSETAEQNLFKKCIRFPITLLESYSKDNVVRFHFTIKVLQDDCVQAIH